MGNPWKQTMINKIGNILEIISFYSLFVIFRIGLIIFHNASTMFNHIPQLCYYILVFFTVFQLCFNLNILYSWLIKYLHVINKVLCISID